MLNSLSATLIKMTAPGVPDFYQGTEIWDFSLVDPDNRRPVDYDLRRSLMDGVSGNVNARDLLADWKSGAVKLHLIHRTLQFRADHRELFERGRYIPLDIQGVHANHLIAFARVLNGQWAITIVPRLTARLARETGRDLGQIPLGFDAWRDTRIILPDGAPTVWNQPLTSGQFERAAAHIDAAAALGELPVALQLGAA